MAKTATKSHNDLEDNTKKTAIQVLQSCLTSSIDLYNTTRQAHWNVKGHNFHGLHLMFETFYGTIETDIDEIAERLVQLGGTAVGISQDVAAKTPLPAYPTDIKLGQDHVAALIERYSMVAKATREGIDQTDEAGDADTADLLTAVSRNLDKALWMLEATATN